MERSAGRCFCLILCAYAASHPADADHAESLPDANVSRVASRFEVNATVSSLTIVSCIAAFDELALHEPPFYLQAAMSLTTVIVVHFALPADAKHVKWYAWPLIAATTLSVALGCFRDVQAAPFEYCQGTVSILAGMVAVVVFTALVKQFCPLPSPPGGRSGGNVLENCIAMCEAMVFLIAITIFSFAMLAVLLVAVAGAAFLFSKVQSGSFVHISGCQALRWIKAAVQIPKIFQACVLLENLHVLPMTKRIASAPFLLAVAIYTPPILITGCTHILPGAMLFFPATFLLLCVLVLPRLWNPQESDRPCYERVEVDDSEFHQLLGPSDSDTEAIGLPPKSIRDNRKHDAPPPEEGHVHVGSDDVEAPRQQGMPQEAKNLNKIDPQDAKEKKEGMPPEVAAQPPKIKLLQIRLAVKLLLAFVVIYWQFEGEAMVRWYQGASWSEALLATWRARTARSYFGHLMALKDQAVGFLPLTKAYLPLWLKFF